MNSKFKEFFKVILVYFASVLLAVISAEGGGLIYSGIYNTNCGDNLFIIMNFDKGCKIEGFTYTYIFWIALLSYSVFNIKKALIIFIVGTFIFWVISILLIIPIDKYDFFDIHDLTSLFIMIAVSILGFIIPFGFKRILNLKK